MCVFLFSTSSSVDVRENNQCTNAFTPRSPALLRHPLICSEETEGAVFSRSQSTQTNFPHPFREIRVAQLLSPCAWMPTAWVENRHRRHCAGECLWPECPSHARLVGMQKNNENNFWQSKIASRKQYGFNQLKKGH